MRNVGSSALLLATAAALVGLTAPQAVGAQDYAQFEIRYMEALPGHARDLEQALGEHNRRFHSEGSSRAVVAMVLNGPRAGQYIWRMGPGTWTAWDARPGDEAHASDWADNVLAHGRSGLVEYEKARFAQQCAGNADAMALTARQLPAAVAGSSVESFG